MKIVVRNTPEEDYVVIETARMFNKLASLGVIKNVTFEFSDKVTEDGFPQSVIINVEGFE